MANNRQIAEDVLKAVGGKENVENVVHCMTRLRFILRDKSILNEDVVKSIPGVLGMVQAGGQIQIIIGQNVSKVYDELCAMAGFSVQEEIKENAEEYVQQKSEASKSKLSFKQIGSNILNYMAGSMTPLIPVIVAGGMFRVLLSILGPDLLGIIGAESDTYIVLDFVYDAAYYFLPIYLGYTAAKKLGCSTVLGMMLGGILIDPKFIALDGAKESFSVFGIPCTINNYAQSVLPILLSVWVLFYVEKFLKKYIPEMISTIFVPFLSILIMVPVSLCVLAPLGGFLGNYVGTALVSFGNISGFIGIAVIAALWEVLVMSGMHLVLLTTAFTMLMSNGFEALICPAASCATWAAYGIALGAFLRIRNKQEKALNLGYFVSGMLGGVTEPSLYGCAMKFKRPFITMGIGAALGGAYAGLTNTKIYMMASSNFLGWVGFAGGTLPNLINGIIAMVIALISSAVLTYFFGFEKTDPLIQKK